LTNNILKYGLFLTIFLTIFIFTGCSQKSFDGNIDDFYRNTNNPKINNSREMHKYTMRPYTVFGITYYPFVAKLGDEFDGIASWYGPDFHSKKTSNGEIYDMYDMTAAHKTLPMNTVVRVDNQENGRSIIVRINDRGPFVRGRIIDLSNKAARDIDMVGKGTAKVKITVLGYNGEIENKNAPDVELTPNSSFSRKKERVDTIEPLEIKEDSISAATVPVKSKSTTVKTTPVINNTNKSVSNKVSSVGKFSVQVGAFSQEDGALKVKNDTQKKFASNKVDLKKVDVNGKTFFKVFIGGFDTYENAQIFKNANGLSNSVISGN
jgi:rare lipoprotein A